MKVYRLLFILQLLSSCFSRERNIIINTDFPGGNVIVDQIAGDTVILRPDNRDSEKPWFYWYFEVESSHEKEVVFKFKQKDVITVFGPGVSLDQGKSWNWLFEFPSDQNYFEFTFPDGKNITRFSMGMPYLQSDL